MKLLNFKYSEDDYKKTIHLIGRTFPKTIGRVAALSYTFKQIHDRWKYKVTETDLQRRGKNRVLATYCGPGGGKTFFLNILSHIEEYLERRD